MILVDLGGILFSVIESLNILNKVRNKVCTLELSFSVILKFLPAKEPNTFRRGPIVQPW